MKKTVSHHPARRAFIAAVTLVAATSAGVPVSAAFAQADSYPNRPITLIVPWPAGGSTDRHFRTVSKIASEKLGQDIIIDNRPGAGGTLGPGSMALSAKPDGYTVAQFPMGMLRMPFIQKTQWDPINDFSFIIGLSGYTFGLTVRSDSPFRTLDEYVQAAREKPGIIDYGHTGIGSSPHLLMEELAMNAKVQFNNVPYKGNADLITALMGGHIMAQSDATGWDKFVDSGDMRLLVTFGENRTKRWPQVPTAKDLGYKVVASSPYGLVGPKGMDPKVMKVLHDAFKEALADPRHEELMQQLNQEVWYKSSQEYADWARETYAHQKELITKLGLAKE